MATSTDKGRSTGAAWSTLAPPAMPSTGRAKIALPGNVPGLFHTFIIGDCGALATLAEQVHGGPCFALQWFAVSASAFKSSTRYIAKALPHPNGGYLGQFSFPGGVPQFVTKGGTPVIYDNEQDAEADAAIACIKACNARYTFRVQPTDAQDDGVRRLSNLSQEVYTKLTGPEFAVLVAECNMTPNFFSYINAISPERFFQWVDGATAKDGRRLEIPHNVRVLLEIFKRIPQAIDIAEEVTEKVTKQRKPRREG
jgi:hypothetical protein